jgi:beta-aspartyl-peptidase (threonine type)
VERKTRWLLLGGAIGIVLGAYLATRANAIAQGKSEAGRVEIERVLSDQETAWNRGEVDAFLAGYWHSPKLSFSGNSGVTRGWEGVLARYRKNYPDRAAMGQLNFSDLEFRFLGPDAALVLGKWHLQREKDELGGVFTLVWQRFPDGWKIIHDHTSAVTPSNP